MSHDDPFARLASVDPGTRAPALTSIAARARGLRRARTGLRAGSALGVAGLLALGGTLGVGSLTSPSGGRGDASAPSGSGGFLGITSARADEPDCTATAEWLERTQWASVPQAADLVRLMADPPLAASAVGLRQENDPCPVPYASAVLYDTDPVRGIALYARVGPAFAPDAVLETATIHGRDAQWRSLEGGMTAVAWTEADGTQWVATAHGFDPADALGVLDQLTISGHEVDVTDVPDGLDVAEPTGAAPTVRYQWWAEYGTQRVEQPATGLNPPTEPPAAQSSLTYASLRVSPAGEPWQVALAGGGDVQVTSVAGVPAVYTPEVLAGQDRLAWTAGGVTYELWADGGGLNAMLALAARVTPVAADSTEVAAVPTVTEVW